MPDNIYLQNYNIPEDGVLVEYRTTGEYTPAHWHDSLELVYILNGNATIYLEGSEHKLVPGEFIVIDTNQIHEARCTHSYMMIVLRIDDDLIQRLMSNKRNFQIICSRAELTDELVPRYLEICERLKDLVTMHVKQPKGYMIATQSIALDILYRLISDFSIPLYKEDLPEPSRNQLRIREIVSYIDKHYMEPLSLEQIADVSEQLFLGGTSGSLGLFLLGHELVHSLDHQEDTEGNDEEVENVLQEQTILDGCTDSLGSNASIGCYSASCIGNGINGALGTYCACSIVHHLGDGGQVILQTREVNTTSEHTNCGHQHVIHQRGNDFAESSTDDNTDSHVHHIALHGKLLKLFNKSHNFSVFKD